jgi:hypothetical protein
MRTEHDIFPYGNRDESMFLPGFEFLEIPLIAVLLWGATKRYTYAHQKTLERMEVLQLKTP